MGDSPGYQLARISVGD